MKLTSSPDDFSLLDAWQQGDGRAGNRLFERHFDAIYRFFANKTGNDGADLVQRTFLGCIEARDRFRRTSSFRTFLFAIARNELRNHWRQRRKHEHVASNAPAPASASACWTTAAPRPRPPPVTTHRPPMAPTGNNTWPR